MKTATAKEIQEDVVRSQQALIKEAHELLASAHTKVEHAERLNRLGFTASQDVAVLEDVKSAQTIKALQEKYAMKYPGLMFIPTAVMDSVCARYGLVLGGVERYTGTVPEWAAKAIEANRHLVRKEIRMRNMLGLPVVRIGPKGLRPGDQVAGVNRIATIIGSDSDGDATLDAPTAFSFGSGFKLTRSYIPSKARWSPVASDLALLTIAAPLKDMRVERNEMVIGNHIVAIPEDPIVSLQVVGGYIVLTAWGEEGQDPRVFNAGNN